jgi:hypothetical protein
VGVLLLLNQENLRVVECLLHRVNLVNLLALLLQNQGDLVNLLDHLLQNQGDLVVVVDLLLLNLGNNYNQSESI